MVSDTRMTIQEMKNRVADFAHERGWQECHNPKDLAESICIEAAELLEIFQWFSPAETLSWKDAPSKLKYIKEELADVLVYCLSMANVMEIDITKVVLEKLKKNRKKYPIDKFYGKARL